MPWTKEELTEFCKKPLLAVLSTTSPSGDPQATAIWYEFDGQDFLTTAFDDRAKTKNIRRNPHVSLCVTDPEAHDGPLMAKCTARIESEGVEEATRRMARKYFNADEAKQRADQLLRRDRIVIRMTPTKFLDVGS